MHPHLLVASLAAVICDRKVGNSSNLQILVMSQDATQQKKSALLHRTQVFANPYRAHDCTATTFICTGCSILVTFLGAALGLRSGGFLCFLCIVAMMIYSMSQISFQLWWAGEVIPTECKVVNVWVLFTPLTWLALLVAVKCEVISCIYTFLSPSFTEAIESAWEDMKPLMTGPEKAFYESFFFKKMCEDAFHKADINEQDRLDVQGLRVAMCSILRDPDWGRDDWWMSALLSAHKTLVLTKLECLKLMKYFHILYTMGPAGSNASHDFHLLHLPSTASPEEVKQAYSKLSEEFKPSI